jgi:hypothetical protein
MTSWLIDVFEESRQSNWCMRPWCTTCGTWKFRSSIFFNAFKSETLKDWQGFVNSLGDVPVNGVWTKFQSNWSEENLPREIVQRLPSVQENLDSSLKSLTAYSSSPPDDLVWDKLRKLWDEIKTPQQAFDTLSPFELEIISNGTLGALRSLDSLDDIPDEGLRTIFIDLQISSDNLGWGYRKIDQLLEGTVAGDYLNGMRIHADAISRARQQRKQQERENTEQRVQRLSKHKERQDQLKINPPKPRPLRIKDGQKPVYQFLRDYLDLSDDERLNRLAVGPLNYSLDWITKDQIPLKANVKLLSAAELIRVIDLIDNRQGKWLRLKNRLNKRHKTVVLQRKILRFAVGILGICLIALFSYTLIQKQP